MEVDGAYRSPGRSSPVAVLLSSERTPERAGAPDLARAAAIFLFVFATYFVGYSRTLPPTADEMVNFSLAQSLAKWQILSIDQVSTVGPNPEEFGTDGHRYGKYGPLQAVLSVPLFWLAQRLPFGAVDTVLLLNHLATATTAALLFLLVRRLGYRPLVGLGIVVVVAYGTPLWVHSKRYFGEPTITLGIVATVLAAYQAATTRRRGWLIATGLAFGVAVAAKYVNVALLAPVPLYLALTSAHPAGAEKGVLRRVEGERRRSWRHLVWAGGWFAVGATPVLALLGVYDALRFGSPLATGYAHWEGFSTPVWEGVAGFLFSPGKSIFVYTPLFLLLPFWAPRFVRRFPSFSVLLGSIVALHLLVFGSWWVWWGAWAWGPRFVVPVLPLLALFLAEGLARLLGGATAKRPRLAGSSRARSVGTWSAVVVLAALSLGIQVLGVAVDHTIYLVQLLPLNLKPDTLTIWDLRYSPILGQIPLLTRRWLDFAWVERSGPHLVDGPPLAAALVGVAGAIGCLPIVWRAKGWRTWGVALALGTALVGGGTFQALRIYTRQIDPTMARLVAALDRVPATTAVVQLIPSGVIPYANWQKRNLPELGWIEEPTPSPIIVARLTSFAQRYPGFVVLTETPAKSPSNGIEAMLDRTMVQIGEEPIGRFRLLRYATRPESVRFVDQNWRFGRGIDLTGFAAVDAPAMPGRTINVVLRWRSSEGATRHGYTVFVHLVTASGALVAQHDDPPASGYLPTTGWRPGQVVYDNHAIVVPPDAPADLHLVQVGLYRPEDGRRLPLVGASGKAAGDAATLDLNALK